MQKQEININSYPIFVGTNLIENLSQLINFQKYSKVLIITDENLAKNWLEKARKSIPVEADSLILSSQEEEKNINSALKIWEKMQEFGMDRKSLVLNLGGGLIGDIGGFAAATFMRGVDYIHIPTTLLSQVDSSIGGKVGVNLKNLKNMIGTFQFPKAVIIDIETLLTLPIRDLRSGFAEVIKHAFIKDKEFLNLLTSKNLEDFTKEDLIKIIKRSVEIKSEIVNEDVKERGLRKILNFGHTIGHALESLSLETVNPLTHGEAVSIGMVAESKLSVIQKLLKVDELEIIKKTLQKAGLPTSFTNFDTEEVYMKMLSDKKNEKGEINFSLLESIGSCVINQKASKEQIVEALNFIREK